MTDTPGDGVDLDALVALAKAATSGPWRFVDDNAPGQQYPEYAIEGPQGWITRDLRKRANAAYLAACDPATILGLVERVKEAEAELAAVDSWDRTKAGIDPAEVWEELSRTRQGITALIDKADEWVAQSNGRHEIPWVNAWDLRAVINGGPDGN